MPWWAKMGRIQKKADAYRRKNGTNFIPCSECGGPSNVTPELYFQRNRDKVKIVCSGCLAKRHEEKAKEEAIAALHERYDGLSSQ